jgi:hypothetical protein
VGIAIQMRLQNQEIVKYILKFEWMIKREQHPTIKPLAATSPISDNTDLSSKHSCSGLAHFRVTVEWVLFFSMRNACAVILAPLFRALDNTNYYEYYYKLLLIITTNYYNLHPTK